MASAGSARPGASRLLWRDVEAVYRMELILNGFKQSQLKIVSTDGREVIFDLTIERNGELAGLIQVCSAEAMRPRKREEAGACGAEFGPVLVGPVGVSLEGWLTPWEAVARYGISGGRLWFHFRGRRPVRASRCAASPTYLRVTLALLGEVCSAASPRGSGLPAIAGS